MRKWHLATALALCGAWAAAGGETKTFPSGVTYLDGTVVLTAADSGTVWKGEPGAVLSGGRRITGWRREADGLWSAAVPWVTDRAHGFRHLSVNGVRRSRAVEPNEGYFTSLDIPRPDGVSWEQWEHKMERTRVPIRSGEIDPNWNLAAGEIVFYHFWVDSHCTLASQTVENGTNWLHLATSVKRNPYHCLWHLENLREIADRPGEWALVYGEKRVYYRPADGEDMATAEVIAPHLEELVRLDGAKDVRFEGLTFADARYELPAGERNDLQASRGVAAAVVLTNAVGCVFERCAFRRLGGYAFDLRAGTRDCRILACRLTQLGAGGVRLDSPGGKRENVRESDGLCRYRMEDPRTHVSNNEIADCEIADYGIDFTSAVGVLCMSAEGTRIHHNSIHDGYYTGVSVGWNWGYQPSIARDNEIEHNHIYNIGKGLISDMGGIYTLGVSPGTKIRHNLIHDIDARYYGGWGIYPDEGSTGLLIEDNIVYGTKFAPFHQHFGRNNTVRNNIFAGGRIDQLARSRRERHCSFFFYNNIVYWEEGRLHTGDWKDEESYDFTVTSGCGRSDDIRKFIKTTECDYNLYFNPKTPLRDVKWGTQDCSWNDWRTKYSQDAHSVWGDPLFVDAAKHDYRLKPRSPALALGFRPIDPNGFGPRVK